MSIIRSLARLIIPEKARNYLLAMQSRLKPQVKHLHELSFWEARLKEERPENDPEYYRKFMMDMGGVKDQSFFDGLICLDIGPGPRGSLNWLTNARFAIGLDPLVEDYMKFGIAEHSMLYVNATAESIPFATSYVDVVFSMNSLDHVDDIKKTCAEIRRVLKPGGYFIGSLNLDEPKSACEPWTLTKSLLERDLFAGWEKQYYEIRPKVDGDLVSYKYFYEECPEELLNAPGPKALWCRLRVPVNVPPSPIAVSNNT